MAQSLSFRPPTTSDLPQPAWTPPTTDWLTGTWHVTHSTLPMWKSKRNVTITYKPLPPSTPSPAAQDGTNRLDDLVTYQALSSDKVKTMAGVDTANGTDTGSWEWRGKGMMMLITSHWEILGYGEVDSEHQWAVTYFSKTLFTPAGCDIYSRAKEGLPEAVLSDIKKALAGIEYEPVQKLAEEIFEVKRD